MTDKEKIKEDRIDRIFDLIMYSLFLFAVLFGIVGMILSNDYDIKAYFDKFSDDYKECYDWCNQNGFDIANLRGGWEYEDRCNCVMGGIFNWSHISPRQGMIYCRDNPCLIVDEIRITGFGKSEEWIRDSWLRWYEYNYPVITLGEEEKLSDYILEVNDTIGISGKSVWDKDFCGICRGCSAEENITFNERWCGK